MQTEFLAFEDLFVIICGIVMGTLARIMTLKIDSRQYPSFPNGVFINLVTGFVAACLGAVAIPALLAKNFIAVTFLTLAVQHFRDIRKMERDSLRDLDSSEYTTRGNAYIDGISKTYEARNYICLLTAFITVLVTRLLYGERLWLNIGIAVLSGSVMILVLFYFTKGRRIGDICKVTQGKIELKGSELFVDGIYVANTLGTDISRKLFREEGMAFVIHPDGNAHRVTLENYGQRQAILFEAVRSFGVKRYQFVRRNFEDGRIVIAFVPIIPDAEGILKTIRSTPILESSRKMHDKRRKS